MACLNVEVFLSYILSTTGAFVGTTVVVGLFFRLYDSTSGNRTFKIILVLCLLVKQFSTANKASLKTLFSRTPRRQVPLLTSCFLCVSQDSHHTRLKEARIPFFTCFRRAPRHQVCHFIRTSSDPTLLFFVQTLRGINSLLATIVFVNLYI
jgi:hypothetical protein